MRESWEVRSADQNDPMSWNNWTDETTGPSEEHFDASILRTLSVDEEDSGGMLSDFTGDFVEKVVLVGVGDKLPYNKRAGSYSFSIDDSLQELERLSDTAGLEVVGCMSQNLEKPNPRTYIGAANPYRHSFLPASVSIIYTLTKQDTAVSWPETPTMPWLHRHWQDWGAPRPH